MDRRAQMREWLALREREGLSLRELSQRTGVPRGTLGFWAWKLGREREDGLARRGQGRAGFVELVAKCGDQSGLESSDLEIVLGGDRRIVLRGAVDEERLVRVVRALERC